MNIAYTIMSVDESRAAKKNAIRSRVTLPEVTDIAFVDGRIPGLVNSLVNESHVRSGWKSAKAGHLGIWLSNIRCWQWLIENEYDGLLVFQDDAILKDDFMHTFTSCVKELPNGWDAFTSFVPKNQMQDYKRLSNTKYVNGVPTSARLMRDRRFNQFDVGSKIISKVYQGYSCVAMLYSKAGAQKILPLLDEYGMSTTMDCWIFEQAHMENINMYALKPEANHCVEYDWDNDVSIKAATPLVDWSLFK